MQSSSTLTINLAAIRNNLQRLSSTCGSVMVMVKANAYGTDNIMLSKFVQAGAFGKIPFLGVSHVWEGIQLREHGITLPIFVISAPPHEAEATVHHHLTPAVSSFEEVDALNNAAKKMGTTTAVHLHLDTGMHRFGISSAHALDLYHAIKKSSNLHLDGVMTHFIGSENTALDGVTRAQIGKFKALVEALPAPPKWIHAANSAGAVRFPMPFCNLARIGLGVVGYGVCVEGSEPALQLTTTLVSVRACSKGETVGYDCAYTFEKEKGTIGVIPIGYYDGFHRRLSSKGYVLIQGKKAPMIGNVCMDFLMIDLTDIPEAQVGDEVSIFGPQLSPETVAKWAKTDVREILVSMPTRVKRAWTNLNPPILRNDYDNEARSAERLPGTLLPIEKDPSLR